MSSTITVNKWCDNVNAHEQNREPATQFRTVLNEQGKPVELDLCDWCDESVVAIFALAKLGSPVRVVAKPEQRKRDQIQNRQYPCPRCDYAAFNMDGFGKHTRRQHGLTTAEAMGEIADEMAKQGHQPLTVARAKELDKKMNAPLVEGPLPRQQVHSGKGRPPAGTPRTWKCRVPKCTWPGSVSQNGIYQHIKKEHGLYRDQYNQRYGAPVEETD